MDAGHLYQQVIESIRNDILSGRLKSGEALPPMRQMAERWNCTTGTILRAYKELAHQGLVVSHVGRGTRVAGSLPGQNQRSLRRAALFNRMENLLLEIMTAGYTPDEVEESLRVALDRWRTYSSQPEESQPSVLRFVGSHDPSLALIAAHFHEQNPALSLQLSFTGSLGGLIALAEQHADLAGCHLWDEHTNTYNKPFVRKLLPGRRTALLTLVHRRVGLILPVGNPLKLKSLKDLTRPEVRFVNRQPGSGTRVWLDAQLRALKINPGRIRGFGDERMTHSEVALAVSKGQADAGLGVETAAISFGLDFKLLTTERYDLVIPADKWGSAPVQALCGWLATAAAKTAINDLGGYDTRKTGSVTWVE